MPSPDISPVMSASALKLEALLNAFSIEAADAWLRQVFGSYDTTMRRTLVTGENQNERTYFKRATLLGYVKDLAEAPRSSTNRPLLVVSIHMKEDLAARDSRVAQFNFAKRVIKEAINAPQIGVHGLATQGLFFFHDDNGHFRLSLVSGNIIGRRFDFNSATRQSFFVTSGEDNPTIRRRFNTSIRTFADVKNVFSVEALTKDFYKSLFDWYIWATEKDKTITFPNDLSTHADDRDYLAEAIIRLITRLMFIWFIKQKGLVPDELFNPESVRAQLKEFDPTSREQDNYYRVILQNLFFATLNCREDKRKFKGNSHRGRNHEYGIATCYRYSDEMQDKDSFMNLMKQIPFLNCTLFDCLDKKEREQDGGRELYLDGFSDRKSHRAHIHNAFFFDEAQGIIPLFRQYEFTVNENSATDTDVALDPELLGKVFENLLGSYNPETKETARKATGAFYTPREIVNYMVRESLKCYLQRVCPFADNERLTDLFNDNSTEQITSFTDEERRALLEAIYNCKILDPACGSGAFPMGVLHIMVHALSRLDANNLVLRERLLARYKEDREILLTGATKAEQEEYIATLDKQLREGQLYPDYARKLYLIENCIYGIDIQPIATQISKLRFFISLLCDQLRTSWDPEAENHGLLSLPNLEAKFVCADSLRSLPKLAGDNLALGTADIQELKLKLEKCRHLVFSARTYETKNKRKEQELEIRDQIRDAVKHAFSTPDEALIEQYRHTIETLQPQLDAVREPMLELRTVMEQADLFSAPHKLIKEIDLNEPRRRELVAQIHAAEKAIAEELSKSNQAGTTELDKLALAVSGWNPYDQNACSDFFDAEWMFNLPNGFDVVIGNPPYVQLQKDKGAYAKKYEDCHYQTHSKSGDMYMLFAERATQLAKENGAICLIIPNVWMQAEAGRPLRAYLRNTRILQLLHFGNVQFFNSATVCVCIILFSKDKPKESCLALSVNSKTFSGCFDLTVKTDLKEYSALAFSDECWLIMDAMQCSIMAKIKGKTSSLKDWNVSINRGILTGFNDAFIIDDAQKDLIISQCVNKSERDKTNLIIRPLFNGRDINPYYTQNSVKNLLCLFPSLHLNINDYPSIKHHLLRFDKRRLEQTGRKFTIDGIKYSARKKTSYEWYETQDAISYWQDFLKHKIVYSETTTKFSFCLDMNGLFCNKTTFILTADNDNTLFFLLAVLNSACTKLWLHHHCPVTPSGGRTLCKIYVEQLPIPNLNEQQYSAVVQAAQSIHGKLSAHAQADICAEVGFIESILAEHYGLTEAEKNALKNFSQYLKNEEHEETNSDIASRPVAVASCPAVNVCSHYEPEDDFLE